MNNNTTNTNKYTKLSNGDDSHSKQLIKDFFKQTRNIDVIITQDQFDYIDAYFYYKDVLVGIEIKDRRDKYYSYEYDDVICEKGKLDKFLKDKKNPSIAKHKNIQRLYVINIYKDGVFYIGDIEDHTPIEKLATKTTEFKNNEVVTKHILSIKRKWGFTIDGFNKIYPPEDIIMNRNI